MAILVLREQLNRAGRLTRKQRRSNQKKKRKMKKAITQLSEQNQSKKAVVSQKAFRQVMI